MSAGKRWQDSATVAFGAFLVISPFVFSKHSHPVAAVSAYLLGVLLAIPGFAGVPGIAWTAGVMAGATVMVPATLRFGTRSAMKAG